MRALSALANQCQAFSVCYPYHIDFITNPSNTGNIPDNDMKLILADETRMDF